MAGFRVGIRNGPERGLTAGAATRTVRAPPRGEGWDLDEVRGEREAARRGNLADSAQLWAMSRDGDAAARCALIECYVPLATRIAHGMNVPVGAVAGPDDLESAALIGLIDAVDRRAHGDQRGSSVPTARPRHPKPAPGTRGRDPHGRPGRAGPADPGSRLARERQHPLLRKEGFRAQLEPSDVREPDRKTQWTQQPDERVVARVPGREDA